MRSVAADSVAPEYNMLFFAALHWDANNLTSESFALKIAKKVAKGNNATTMAEYLNKRAEIYTNALRICKHNLAIYMDYRWLPETNSPFGSEMAEVYKNTSKSLTKLARKLAQAEKDSSSQRTKKLFNQELKRLSFEIAEFKVMHTQQVAVNKLAAYINSVIETTKTECISHMKATIDTLNVAQGKALECGFDPKGWYVININQWLKREFQQKIQKLLN